MKTNPSIIDMNPPGSIQGAKRPSILSFLVDWANLITLMGLARGMLSLYFALNSQFQAAILALLWAVLFDWFDGPIARRMRERTEGQKLFGMKMDSLVDASVPPRSQGFCWWHTRTSARGSISVPWRL